MDKIFDVNCNDCLCEAEVTIKSGSDAEEPMFCPFCASDDIEIERIE